jgi:hypothetical protein
MAFSIMNEILSILLTILILLTNKNLKMNPRGSQESVTNIQNSNRQGSISSNFLFLLLERDCYAR